MQPTYTLTANLLAETTFAFEDWTEGKTVRAKEESFQVGGKGINVAKMLARLDAPTQALCFPGGDHGPMCIEWMEQAGIPFQAFVEGCRTRCGSVIRAPQRKETTFLGLDSSVSKNAMRSCLAYLDEQRPPFTLAICGVIPRWQDDPWPLLRDWIGRRPEKVDLVVDTYGPSLPWFLQQRPGVLKINRDELETLFPESRRSEPTSALLAEAAQQAPSTTWVITDGGSDIWYCPPAREPRSHTPPQIECVSPTGSGDVFLATLLHHLYLNSSDNIDDAVERAADYASRSAAQPGIAEFEL